MATLQRFAFRLLVIVAFAALWPGPSVGLATVMLCLVLAAGCVFAAVSFREPFLGSGLNRWHEAAALVTIALFAYLMF